MTIVYTLLLIALIALVNLMIGFVAGSLFGFGPWADRVLGWFSPEITGRAKE